MKVYPLHKIISVDRGSITPMFIQIANCITQAIKTGALRDDDLLPSINDLSDRMELARDTVEKGYKYLKSLGILEGKPGVGCFIKSTQPVNKANVLLIYNQQSSFEKITYDTFVKHLGEAASIDFHNYSNGFCLLKNKPGECNADYDYYIIFSNYMDDPRCLIPVINNLPRKKLIVAGRRINELTGSFSGVFINYENDVFQALKQAQEKLSKYNSIGLISSDAYLHSGIIIGLQKFCRQYGFYCHLIPDIESAEINKGTVYITLKDDDLVILVERIKAIGLETGKDLGIISYNETPIKKFILNGITTISTDFKKMGEQMARPIINSTIEQTETAFYLTLRNSL